jgi:DNA-binding NtrC family response regulator
VTQYQLLTACTMSTSVTCGRSDRRPRVFIVDSEQVIAHTLAIILLRTGYDAYQFYGAKSALEAAQSVAPDLLLTDVVTPDLDGIELACRITDHCPACKVLLFSGYATTASLLKDERAAGRSFEILPTPLHPNDLLAKVAFRFKRRPRGIVSFRRGMRECALPQPPQACNSVAVKQANSSTYLPECLD